MTEPSKSDHFESLDPKGSEPGTYSPPAGGRRIPVHDGDAPEEPGDETPVAGDAAADDLEEVPPVDEQAEVEEDLEDLRRRARERDDIEDRLKRVAADFANAQKRIEREAQTRIQYATQDFIREILAVTDRLERALDAAEQSQDLEGLIEGMRLVDKQFHDILARHGVEQIPAVKGEPFDPDLHEVMAVVPGGEYPEHAVVEEVERGFRLKDRVVRPSKVFVAGPPAAAPEKG